MSLFIIFIIYCQFFTFLNAQCPVTNCPAITDTGIANPSRGNLIAGQMCVQNSIVNNRLQTTVSCNGYDSNGLIQVFVGRIGGGITSIFPNSQTSGKGPLTVNFTCGDDGNWTLTNNPSAGPIHSSEVFCNVYCTQGIPCSAARPPTCAVAGTPPPSCSTTPKPLTCSFTQCPVIIDKGVADSTNFKAGQMCVQTSVTNFVLKTTVTCNGYDPNGLINIFVRKIGGGVTPVFPNSQTSGKGPLSLDLTCSTDGNWTIAGSPISGTDIYCDVYCQPGVSCTAIRPPNCPSSGISAPLCPTTPTPRPTTTACSCPVGGVWGAWSTSSACTDICGSCGTMTKTRTCASAIRGCPCSGDSTRNTPCNIKPCIFPRPACCFPYKNLLSTNEFICGPQPAAPVDPTTSTSCLN